jgi:hypothetical protein
MRTIKFYTRIFIINLFLFLINANLYSQSDVMIFPRRIVFEGNNNIQEVTLVNNGKDTAKYVISFIEYKMSEDGSLVRIDQVDSNKNYYFASNYLRFFPRSVILAPNAAQVVRIQARVPSDLQAGEYRSHLYFRSVPNESPRGFENEKNDSLISIKLTPIYGLSIPVIIRVGSLFVNVSIGDFNLVLADNPTLFFKIFRDGNKSCFGDLDIYYINNVGKSQKIYSLKGLAVYTPLPYRQMTINLKSVENIDFHNGKIEIVYYSSDKNGNNKNIYFDYYYDLK